jgi:hypothetical protein
MKKDVHDEQKRGIEVLATKMNLVLRANKNLASRLKISKVSRQKIIKIDKNSCYCVY